MELAWNLCSVQPGSTCWYDFNSIVRSQIVVIKLWSYAPFKACCALKCPPPQHVEASVSVWFHSNGGISLCISNTAPVDLRLSQITFHLQKEEAAVYISRTGDVVSSTLWLFSINQCPPWRQKPQFPTSYWVCIENVISERAAYCTNMCLNSDKKEQERLLYSHWLYSHHVCPAVCCSLKMSISMGQSPLTNGHYVQYKV